MRILQIRRLNKRPKTSVNELYRRPKTSVNELYRRHGYYYSRRRILSVIASN